MNLQSLLAEFGGAIASPNNPANAQQAEPSNPLAAVKSKFPGGLAGGAAAGGLVALLLSSKSTRKMATKVAKFGGTAVLGGLAYKAYSNWQQNKALNQTQPLQDNEIQQALPQISDASTSVTVEQAQSALEMVLFKTMIAAAKADGQIDAKEQQRLHSAVQDLNLNAEQQGQLFALMATDVSVQELAAMVKTEEARAEVYLAAYLAIEVDDQRERAFLNDLSSALNLPRGLAAYLEQQADQGVTTQ